MRTRRLLIALAASAVVALVTGCSLLPSAAQPLVAGACLASSDSADSDFHSVVACSEPHRYDVVAVDTWSGMDAALAHGDADDVYTELRDPDSDFAAWVQDWCSTAIRAAVGWSDVELKLESDSGSALTTDNIWAEPSGSFYIDISLAAKPDFVKGDHRVVCSAAWVDETDRQIALTFDKGLGFADLIEPGLPNTTRSCINIDGESVSCEYPGDIAEQFGSFDARIYPGPDSVLQLVAAEDENASIPVLESFDTVCAALSAAVPHRPQGGPPFATVLDLNGDWDRASRTGVLQDDVPYFVNCFTIPPGTP